MSAGPRVQSALAKFRVVKQHQGASLCQCSPRHSRLGCMSCLNRPPFLYLSHQLLTRRMHRSDNTCSYRTSPTGLSAATTVGRYVTIGQGCVLRSATVEDQVLIGEKCVLMEGSLVEHHCVLAPGTVLPPGRLVPSGQMWAGNPAKYVRDLTKDEVRALVSLFRRQNCPASLIIHPSVMRVPSCCCSCKHGSSKHGAEC